MQRFTFTLNCFMWKYFSISFLKVYVSDGRTCILTNHPACIHVDSSLLSPAFVVLVINAPHTEPGNAPDWADHWAFPPQHHFPMLKCHSTYHASCANPREDERWGTKEAGSPEALGCLMPCYWETSIQDKIYSAYLTLPQGKVLALFPGTLIPFQESNWLVLLPEALSMCFAHPVSPVPPPWCVWSWMPHMCPYREGCNYLVDIG